MHYAIVCGSRTYGSVEQVRLVLGDWVMELGADNFRVIAGGAQGPDRQAVEFCETVGVRFMELKADWDRFGKAAGFRRNTQMLEQLQARQALGHDVLVVAFWDGVSKGTGGMITLAEQAGVPVFVVPQPGSEIVGVAETVEVVTESV